MSKPSTIESPTAKVISEVAAVLGFDPTKGPRPNKDAFSKALEKITEERQRAAELAAEELARSVIDQVEAFGKVKKQFEQTEQKFLKEVQKTMNKVKALANGQEVSEEEETEAKN